MDVTVDTAYCKNKYTQKWYSFDDSHVSEVNVDSVCVSLIALEGGNILISLIVIGSFQSSSSYVLFYARQSDGGDTHKRGVDRSLSVPFMDVLKQENKGINHDVYHQFAQSILKSILI